MEALIAIGVITAIAVGIWAVRLKVGVAPPRAGRAMASAPMTPSASASANDASRIVAAMLRSHEPLRFAAFCPVAPQGPVADEGVINLQLSVEEGAIGLDWVLEAPRNVTTAPEVQRFVESRGFSVVHHEVNGVRYLRTEGSDVASLATEILVDLFGLDPSDPMYLVVEGFEWPPGDQRSTEAEGAG